MNRIGVLPHEACDFFLIFRRPRQHAFDEPHDINTHDCQSCSLLVEC